MVAPSFETRRRQSTNRGYSFLEFLLVLAVAGLVVVIVMPRLFGGVDNANLRIEESTADMIQQGIRRYEFEYGLLPATLDQAELGPSSRSNPLFDKVVLKAEKSGRWQKLSDFSYMGPTGNLFEYCRQEGSFCVVED